jgi:hypothetical protein
LLREIGGYTVLNFGYEKIIPELSRYVSDKFDERKEIDKTLSVIRRAPDYAVINHSKKKVTLIEVKWMTKLTKSKVLSIASGMSESWNPSSLFIATPTGFYFDEIEEIIQNDGEIKEYTHPNFTKKQKDRYLKILNDFEAPSIFEQ